jgi:hypothetical protein
VGCIRLSVNGHCDECDHISGYYSDEFRSCGKCPKGCGGCTSPNFCLTCDEGYYKSKFICHSCNPSESTIGCGTCHLDEAK